MDNRAILGAAKQLILDKKYDQARAILKTIPNDPIAIKWLQQINARYPELPPLKDTDQTIVAKRPKTTKRNASGVLKAVIFIVSLCAASFSIIYGYQWFQSLNAQGSQIATVIAATTAPSTLQVTSKWKSSATVDKLDNSKNVSVFLDSDDTFNDGVIDQHATLIVRCRSGKPDLYVATGAVVDTDYDTGLATVRIRLDDGAVHGAVETAQLSGSTDHESLFFADPVNMTKALLAVQGMVLEFTPFEEPKAQVTFDLRGLSDVIQPVRDACGW